MSLEDDIRVISGVPMFEDLSLEQLRLLAFGAERIKLAKDRELYHAGQNAECGYVVVTGKIALFRDTLKGREVIRRVGPGTLLGELALITEMQRMTGAAATEDAQVIRINRSLFRRMLEEYPETAAALHGRLTDQLHDLLEDIGTLDKRFAEK